MSKSRIDHVGRVDVFKETKVFDWETLWSWIGIIAIALFLLKACGG